MKNKSKRALALVLLLPLYCRYTSTLDLPGPFNSRNFLSLQNGRQVTPTEEGTLEERGLDRLLSLNEKRRTLASVAVTRDPDIGERTRCSLSPTVLAQITKPSASEWLVDDQTVKLLDNNLQQLIRCTEPFDKVLFSTQQTIRLTEAIEVIHELEFLRAPQATLEGKNRHTSRTIFRCPKSGPVLLIKTSNFTAVDIIISKCKKPSSHGTIVVRPRSAATLKHVRIEDNKITGVYIHNHASVTINEAYFSENEVIGNGSAIHAKDNTSITITHSWFEDNTAINGSGGAIWIGNSDTLVINDSYFIGNNATCWGGGLSVGNESTLTMFGSRVTDNVAQHGGGIFLGANNTANMHGVLLADNVASTGGAIDAGEKNTLTTSDSIIAYNNATYGAAIFLLSYNYATIRISLLLGNNASSGGAIFANASNTLAFIDSDLSDNFAENFGGAMHLESYNKATLQASVLSNNYGADGGAMSLCSNNKVTMQLIVLSKNTAWDGGAIFCNISNAITITDSLLLENGAIMMGGAICLHSYNTASLQRVRMLYNHAMFGGALLVVKGNRAFIVDSVLSNNFGDYTTKYGRGLYRGSKSNSLTVKNTTITSRSNAHEAEVSYPYSALDGAIDAVHEARVDEEAKHVESVAY